MNGAEIERKLDTIASILKIAHKDDIERARIAIRSEPGKAAILDKASSWMAGGALVKAVATKVKKSDRSIQIYIAELLELGVLEKRGAGRSTEYRTTGVV